MILPTNVANVRHSFQKYSKCIYLPLICVIVLTTIYVVLSDQRHLCSKIFRLKSSEENLNENPSIYCLIVLFHPNDSQIALKVKTTWSNHCSRALFVSEKQHEVLEPLVIRQPSPIREHKWQRLKLALRYLYENHFDEVDWLLISDETNENGNNYIAVHGQATWIKNCDRYLFVSNDVHAVLEPLLVKYRDRWDTMKVSLFHVHQYYANDLDWLLMVYDNNYVVLENLRKMLKPYSPDEPINFGCKMWDNDNQTYMHGGIVLSHEALRRLVVEGFTNSSLCNPNDSAYASEEMGKCLKNLGVVDGDSRDAMGRHRFIPFPPEHFLTELSPEKEEWFVTHSFYEINATMNKLSPEAISFSDVSPATMVTLHYYIYKLRIFGRKVHPQNVTNHLGNNTQLS